MKNSIFEFTDYKAYFRALATSSPSIYGHGFRSKIAAALRCQTAYVSHVLNKDAHFSLEQGAELSELLGHSKDESKYFQLLIRRARAGTHKLRNMLDEEVDEIHARRESLKERVDKTDSLSAENQMRYYSRWYYSAVHILTTIHKFQKDVDAMSAALGVSREHVVDALDFLVSTGLVRYEKGRYSTGRARLFLDSESPMIAQLHTNWRMRAIESLDKKQKSDLHYSTCVSLSAADFKTLKNRLITMINEARSIIKESREEDLCCLNLDFFSLLR